MIEPAGRRLTEKPGAYRKILRRNQKTFANLVTQLELQNRPALIIFEGWGAAGKGDIIRLVTAKLDPRRYSVYANHRPVGADANHHYLWRYWEQLPELGRLVVFDRSWYRRVLIERIEGTCTEEQWVRAYHEINQVERQLNDFGCILAKFWLQISPDEQLRRFESRVNDDTRRWKIGPDDWHRRDRLSDYQEAVDDMLAGTSTVIAPWTVIDSDSKSQSHLQTFDALLTIFTDELKLNAGSPTGKARSQKKKRVNA